MLIRRKMFIKNKDAATIAKFLSKLNDHAARIGGIMVHYDPDSAIWIMKADHF